MKVAAAAKTFTILVVLRILCLAENAQIDKMIASTRMTCC